jgi:hypothetical protein
MCQEAVAARGGFCVYERERESRSPYSQPQFSAGRFCRVNNYGQESCHYTSLRMCEQAVESMGGFCVYERR